MIGKAASTKIKRRGVSINRDFLSIAENIIEEIDPTPIAGVEAPFIKILLTMGGIWRFVNNDSNAKKR